jgi:hypothetical protein
VKLNAREATDHITVLGTQSTHNISSPNRQSDRYANVSTTCYSEQHWILLYVIVPIHSAKIYLHYKRICETSCYLVIHVIAAYCCQEELWCGVVEGGGERGEAVYV